MRRSISDNKQRGIAQAVCPGKGSQHQDWESLRGALKRQQAQLTLFKNQIFFI